MNGVMGNGAVLPRNCSAICIDDERIRGQFGGHSLVETSCKPQPHVFHLNGALREAVGRGEKECLEILISPRVAQRTPDLNGPLCAAAEGGRTECLRFLIDNYDLDLDHAL